MALSLTSEEESEEDTGTCLTAPITFTMDLISGFSYFLLQTACGEFPNMPFLTCVKEITFPPINYFKRMGIGEGRQGDRVAEDEMDS